MATENKLISTLCRGQIVRFPNRLKEIKTCLVLYNDKPCFDLVLLHEDGSFSRCAYFKEEELFDYGWELISTSWKGFK